MLDPALNNELIEIVAAGFRTNEINELGRLFLPCFDSNALLGIGQNVSLSPRKAARMLVEESARQKKLRELVQLIVELDGGIILGRPVQIEQLEAFLGRLARSGLLYDFRRRKLVSSREDNRALPNWGCLKDGKIYDITVLSTDIVDNSRLVKRYGIRRLEKVYYRLWAFLNDRLRTHDGRMWSWAGDGGIMAFTFADHVHRGVRCALEIQCSLPVFNLGLLNALGEPVSLRLALDTGKIKFFADTGKIVSDVINYAAHLEKKGTREGSVAVSRPVWEALDPASQALFRFNQVFEDQDSFCIPSRLDQFPMVEEALPQEHRGA